MKKVYWFFVAAALAALSAGFKFPNGYVETDLVVDQQVNGIPTLVDSNGIKHIAQHFDPNLLNPWGIATSASSPFWISDNGAGVSTLYNSAGVPQSLVVLIPGPGNPLGNDGTPTGTVFNSAGAGTFMVSGVDNMGNPKSASAVFLFATEDGTILGWNPAVNPAGFDPQKAGKYAIIMVNHSPGAVYKGLTMATDSGGTTRLYATNFRAGTVDVFDTSFKQSSNVNAFNDSSLPNGYAPFNIVPLTINGTPKLFVTFAVQDDMKHDDVAGQGHGIVDTFALDGTDKHRFAQHGQLDSPWGVALTPHGFGHLAGTVWIGNFGNGHINAYDPSTGEFVGKVRNSSGHAIVIDGLWAIRFGNGGNGGLTNTLYFTAGVNGESDGLFGSLSPE